MTPELVYQKILLKGNKLNSNFNSYCDKAKAVLIVNEVLNTWITDKLKYKDSILIDDLQAIVKQVELFPGTDKTSFQSYILPKDFFQCISVECEVQRGKCKKKIFSREIKGQNRNLFQYDENQQPDFDWEWTFHQIATNSLKVYKEGFQILKSIFSYYKTLPEFDVAGYIKLDNTPSSDKPIPLQDRFIDEIINYAVEELMRDFENNNGLQIAKDRQTNKQ